MAAANNAAKSAVMDGEYPFAHTEACKMLAKALEQAEKDKGWSQRQVAKMLNYKASVVISHMAAGRVPIPVDRANDIARLLRMDYGDFLLAVLEQRHPDIDFKTVLKKLPKGTPKPSTGSMFADELERIAGVPLDELPIPTLNVMREVISDRKPERRWLAMNEVPLVEHLRNRRPEGITPGEMKKLTDCIDAL